MDRVRVLVERGPHAKVPSECFDYELPILDALHGVDGEEFVPGYTEVSRTPYKPKEGKEFDAADAYRALELKYSNPLDAMPALKNVYPNAHAFAKAIAETQPKKRAAA